MTAPDAEWQRATSLRMVNRQRDELSLQGRPFSDRSLAEFAATYVGVCATVVLKWMEGE